MSCSREIASSVSAWVAFVNWVHVVVESKQSAINYQLATLNGCLDIRRLAVIMQANAQLLSRHRLNSAYRVG